MKERAAMNGLKQGTEPSPVSGVNHAVTGVASINHLVSKPDYEAATAASRDERMGWWREARFGMFIHYGYELEFEAPPVFAFRPLLPQLHQSA